MNKVDFKNKITCYIDGELNQSEKIEFEEIMKMHEDLRSLFLDIKRNDELLKNLPRITTTSNFMIKLNKKIDEYNNQGKITLTGILEKYIYNKPMIYNKLSEVDIMNKNSEIIFTASSTFYKLLVKLRRFKEKLLGH